MSWLKLKRLLSHKKVWKVLTNKLTLKLIGSKPNRKPKNRVYKPCKKLGWPSLSIRPKKFKKKPNPHGLIHHKTHHRLPPPPVFVDELLIEPVSAVEAHMVPPQRRASKEMLCSLGEQDSGKEEQRSVNDDHSMVSADEVWESMVLASPQMHEIDERADEFIARFRADMRHQEMQARRS